MSDRLSRLAGAFDWIKVIAAVLIGGIAFIGVQITRVDGRVSALSDKVSALSDKVDASPDKVNANLRELTSTLAQAILASKQGATQVILLPAPQTSMPQPPVPQP